MIKVNCDYKIKEDIDFALDALKEKAIDLTAATGISREVIESIEKGDKPSSEIYEKLYSFLYRNNFRINKVKEELIEEKYDKVLFHGSKNGLESVVVSGSRKNCDFGNGFYLGETYNQALSFVYDRSGSSVYSFSYLENKLNVVKLECGLEWMLSICFFRGYLNSFSSKPVIKSIISKINSADLIIAPIADNKMFFIMQRFVDGDINADVAIHSISSSGLGLQYVFKSDKALNCLVPIERYYLSAPERKKCERYFIERSYEIDTKLKLAKRKFRNGLYIEDILK